MMSEPSNVFEIAKDKCEEYGVLEPLDDEARLRQLYLKVQLQLGDPTQMRLPIGIIADEIKKSGQVISRDV